jgi:hypothetical protein
MAKKKDLLPLGKLTIYFDRKQLRDALRGKSFTLIEQEDGETCENTYIVVDILPLEDGLPVEAKQKNGSDDETWQYGLGEVLESLEVLTFKET